MTNSPIVAVIGIGGIQNQAIARELAQNGFRIRGIGRSRHTSIPSSICPEYRQVDPDSRTELTEALRGAEVVVVTSPIDHRPGQRERLIETVVEAAGKAGTARLVFNAAAAVFDDRTHPVAKVLGALSDAVLAGPVPATVLQPTVYMDNLIAPWSLPSLVNDGVLAYPMPENAPVSWISHRSLGQFVHAAATRPVLGRVFRIGGPEALTGHAMAERLTRVMGRAVSYHRIPLPAFAEGINAAFGPPAGDDIAALYRTMEAELAIMSRDPAEWRDLGVTPETFDDWAKRQAWKIAA
ncbi:MAG: NmrA family NAD(P)-binding protein [Beijerinckiaceae bacterium]|nr:NmrA family NAD(P)-binding protein [Beijerinckiaceae bacterium]MCZ8301792.1 NmrA family NAD(P)-binding protein [Beijerinckiaceae bacterium]